MNREEFLRKFPELIKNYRPSSSVTSHVGSINLLMVIGPSGVGKSTLIEQSGLALVPSDTTRDARPGEKDGIDMYFRTDYQKIVDEIKNGDFVQVAVGSGGDFYATRASSYPADGWAAMPVMADVVPIFRELGFKKTISSFVVPPTFEEWMRRMGSHKLAPAELKKRLAEARRSLSFALQDASIHFILNEEIPSAEKQIKDLLNGEIDKQREEMARQAAQVNYQQIKL